MQFATFPARQPRSHYRHELRTLTYVTLDEANGGIIRNLNHEGVALQAVAAPRVQQRIRLRFELRFPRLRVEAYGQVSWSNPSGQCGIRFVDLPPRVRYQINQWIFSNLLDAVAREATHSGSIFESPVTPIIPGTSCEENDGLTLSSTPRPAIRLEPAFTRREEPRVPLRQSKNDSADAVNEAGAQLSWLYRPISARSLAWLVDSLVVTAALLLFAVIFLSIAHELPEWPLSLSAAVAAGGLIAAAYWAVFAVFRRPSLGARLAATASAIEEKVEAEGVDRFR
jgi:hypothetical protein